MRDDHANDAGTATRQETESPISPGAVIRAARKHGLLKTSAVVKEKVPKGDLQAIRESMLMTIATDNKQNTEYAQLMGLMGLMEDRASGPKFQLSDEHHYAPPEVPGEFLGTKRARMAEQLEKEYVFQLGEAGVPEGIAKKQFHKDLEALEGTLDSLVARPALREQVRRDEAQRIADRQARISPERLRDAIAVFKALADKVEPADAPAVHKATQIAEAHLATMPVRDRP